MYSTITDLTRRGLGSKWGAGYVVETRIQYLAGLRFAIRLRVEVQFSVIGG